MKLIKFDLPLDGTRVKSIEELRQHFTAEVIKHYHSKQLRNWLKCRHLQTEIDGLDRLAELGEMEDSLLMRKLCDIFAVEADDSSIAAMILNASIEKPIIVNHDDAHEEHSHAINEEAKDDKVEKEEKVSSAHTKTNQQSLDKIISEVEHKFRDCHFFYGQKLCTENARILINKAIKSYAFTEPKDKLVFFVCLSSSADGILQYLTADNGIYITENELFLKFSGGQPFNIAMEDIKTINVRIDDKVMAMKAQYYIEINGRRFVYSTWDYSREAGREAGWGIFLSDDLILPAKIESLNNSMKLLVKCIERYVCQFNRWWI